MSCRSGHQKEKMGRDIGHIVRKPVGSIKRKPLESARSSKKYMQENGRGGEDLIGKDLEGN